MRWVWDCYDEDGLLVAVVSDWIIADAWATRHWDRRYAGRKCP